MSFDYKVEIFMKLSSVKEVEIMKYRQVSLDSVPIKITYPNIVD